jgi:hypothetical protein
MADEIEVKPEHIARALEGMSDWVLAVRDLVLKLDPNTTIRVAPLDVPKPPSGFGTNCIIP